LLIFSIIPWGGILTTTPADPVTHETITEPFAWELGWWLPELTALFLVMSVVVRIAARLRRAWRWSCPSWRRSHRPDQRPTHGRARAGQGGLRWILKFVVPLMVILAAIILAVLLLSAAL